MVSQALTVEQIGLLWRAFQIRGVDDDMPKKAAIARKFKSLMRMGKLYVEQMNGDIQERDDPRPGSKVFVDTGGMMEFTRSEAKYLRECLDELTKERLPNGKPSINAGIADDVEHLRETVIPRWLAKDPDEPKEPRKRASGKTPGKRARK